MSKPCSAGKRTSFTWKDACLLSVSILVCIFLIELLYSAFLSYAPKRVHVYDAPYARFDVDTGYLLLPGPKRSVSFHGGKLLWNTTVRPNNLGYNSSNDYEFKKPTPDTKRFIILGDSFTAGDNMDVPWVDKFNEMIAPIGGQAYAFSQQAIGLDNWHGIFFKQIVPHFEFDAVIIACYHNDLSRFFTIFHTEDNTTYYTRTNDPPQTREDFFAKTFPRMIPLFKNSTPENVNNMLGPPIAVDKFSWKWAGFEFRLCRTALATVFPDNNARKTLFEHFYQDPPLRSLDEIIQSDPEFRGLTKLWDILKWCKVNNKPVILCSIPDIERLAPYINSNGRFIGENQRNLSSIAHHYGLFYFDGYSIYLGNSMNDIRKTYWPHEELHWGQEGAHLFARRLSESIEQNRSKIFVSN